MKIDPAQAFAQEYTQIFYILLKKTQDVELARELRQDLFIRMMDSLKPGVEFEGMNQFMAWIHRLARSVYIDHYRRKSVKGKKVVAMTDPELLLRCNSDPSPNWEESQIQKELAAQVVIQAERIAALVEQLYEPQKVVFKMRMEGKLFKEIEQQTGRSLSTVLADYQYAKRNLIKLI